MKKSIFLCWIFILSGLATFAQSVDGWKYAESITEQNLKDLLYVVASEQMQGRETGTEGQRRAAIYLQIQFKKIGLLTPKALDGYQQMYPLYRDSMVSQTLKIGNQQLNFPGDFIISGGQQLSQTIKNNQIVFAGYGIEDDNYSDYKGKQVKGKIVVIMNGEPKVGDKYLVSGTNKASVWAYSYPRKVNLAQDKGAAAVLFVNPGTAAFSSNMVDRLNSSRLYYSSKEVNESTPLVFLTPGHLSGIFGEATAEKLVDAAKEHQPLNKMQASKKVNVEIAFHKKRFSVLASNILGVLPGTDLKDQYVFLTAHYDHLGMHGGEIYYGADDDGSGTVSVVEMARAFKEAKDAGHGPRRTIVFMLVSGEEKGLWGSRYYTDNPAFPLDQTTVDLNTDMIGRIDPNRTIGDSMNYVYVIGNDKLSSDLDPITKEVNNKYTHLELDYKFNDPDDPMRIYYRSDHYNFARKGVPIIFYFDGIHKDYHKPTDTVEKINYDLMEKRARYIFMMAWDIANRDEMLKRDIPLPDSHR